MSVDELFTLSPFKLSVRTPPVADERGYDAGTQSARTLICRRRRRRRRGDEASLLFPGTPIWPADINSCMR